MRNVSAGCNSAGGSGTGAPLQLPMSTTVKLNRDDLLDLLEGARELLPEEVRAARLLLRDREEFLANARSEREQLRCAGLGESRRAEDVGVAPHVGLPTGRRR